MGLKLFDIYYLLFYYELLSVVLFLVEFKFYLHVFPFIQNLTKEQADYCIARMRPYIDKSGRPIPDSYDFVDFTKSMFVN